MSDNDRLGSNSSSEKLTVVVLLNIFSLSVIPLYLVRYTICSGISIIRSSKCHCLPIY